jgi:hypothetical protein
VLELGDDPLTLVELALASGQRGLDLLQDALALVTEPLLELGLGCLVQRAPKAERALLGTSQLLEPALDLLVARLFRDRSPLLPGAYSSDPPAAVLTPASRNPRPGEDRRRRRSLPPRTTHGRSSGRRAAPIPDLTVRPWRPARSESPDRGSRAGAAFTTL